jgi:xylan 1,4-beta-xylosidase
VAAEPHNAADYWRANIDRRSGQIDADRRVRLDPPTEVRAELGRGQVTVSWNPVADAVGYLVWRSAGESGPFEVIDHGGGDVLVIPDHRYADVTAGYGAGAWYAVSAVADIDDDGTRSAAVRPRPTSTAGEVRIRVDASHHQPLVRPWQPMIGSEHLSHVLSQESTGGRPIGSELLAALTMLRHDIGVSCVRAHAILDDDLGVFREVEGRIDLDFDGVDRVYDLILAVGLRPVVELSFMPRDLATNPDETVFAYQAIKSPPRDWDAWSSLVSSLARHLIERYGAEEVRRWPFEVWNEPNLAVFWSGTPDDYFRLYDLTAAALRAVDPSLLVGGPSSAAAGWIEPFLAHADGSGAPVDFISTHTYGNAPIDLRPILERHGRGSTPIWWTEWGPTPTHGYPVGDTVWAAPFLLRGMKSAMGRIGALSHWVASDHFEELGRPTALRHGGFGLLTVGNLHKPRWWALQLLAGLGDHEIAAEIEGDGAASLVEVLATIDDAGEMTVLVWNGALRQSVPELGAAAAAAELSRHVVLGVEGLGSGSYTLRHLRIDESHSNVLGIWDQMSDAAPWPTEEQWAALATADRLEELDPPRAVTISGGEATLRIDLPMPSVSALVLTPS